MIFFYNLGLGSLAVIIIATIVVLVVMPEKYHYKYEGDVIKVEEEGLNGYKYTYIDHETRDTMMIVQKSSKTDGYYTERCAQKKVYTYRWWTDVIVGTLLSSLLGVVVMLLCLWIDVIISERNYKKAKEAYEEAVRNVIRW